jgi:hypothetical protein
MSSPTKGPAAEDPDDQRGAAVDADLIAVGAPAGIPDLRVRAAREIL